ncbi:MAG: HNH endonuclease [Bryobacteraceae bacterium]|jgi:hypothetical protein
MDTEVVDQPKDTIIALLDDRREEALVTLRAVDFDALVQMRNVARSRVWGADGVANASRSIVVRAPRQNPKRADVRATFARDRYTCRYAHCRQPTVHPDVLRLLSAAFPEVVPYHRNWRPLESHILYWTYSTSVEHVISFPSGGTSGAENLITACYLCNDVKNCLPLDLLHWTVGPPAQSTWLGLTEYVSSLKKLVDPSRLSPRNG